MENLNEGKKKKASYMAELAEIDKQSAIVAMEAKINKLAEMVETKNARLSMVSEDENLSELIDKKQVKMMEREIKEIERAKMKLEKLYEKMSGSKKKEVVDEEEKMDEMRGKSSYEEDEDGMREEMRDDSMEEEMRDEKMDEIRDPGEDTGIANLDGVLGNYMDEGKEETNEEFNRFRKLAGIPLKEDISSHKEEAKRFLEKFIDDNKDAFEFIPDLETGYINTKDNSYNVDELASIFLDMGQDIPRGKYNQKYKGEGGTYVVVA
jgi:hypothetical protein